MLQQWAHEAGIPLVGVCEASVHPETMARYKAMVGTNSEAMPSLARTAAVRCMESMLLDGQKSVVMCAFPYPENGGSQHIGRYAVYPDYHGYIRRKLEALHSQLQAVYPDSRFKVFVDSGPVMEKPLAVKAGLGFQGKNTLLIHPEFGSYLFLGGILTTLPVETWSLERTAAVSHAACGDCSECLRACPTGALSAKGLDICRCLSYQTIENRKEVPAFAAQAMKTMAFGCGICEEVCPKNKKAKGFCYADWQADAEIRDAKLQQLEAFAVESFRAHFSHLPVNRIGKAGFLRNLRLVMQNHGK